MKFPPHFSEEELTRSQTATRKGIDNTPNEQEKSNLLRLAWFLETLRDKLGQKYGNTPIYVSSGFRCEELNTEIGGSKTSSHMRGEAADISCRLKPIVLARFIAENMEDYDQIIHEFGRWVHVSISSGVPRHELLTAAKEDGRTVYKKGLI